MNKNKGILVSVIMAEYNTDEQLLKESIESIIKQSYSNFELIIIDDCGKNDVGKIVKSFNDNRIKVYKNQKNSGLIYSLNKAIKLSKGKYIVRMDTDDYSYRDRIEKQIDFLEKNHDIDLVCANCDYYDGNKIWGYSGSYSGKITREKLLNGNPIIHPSVMMKKEVIQNVGGYKDYNRCEDYATWIELYSCGYNLYKISDKLIRYHLSLEDYKKRTLKTRKGYFKLLKTQYLKLKPSMYQRIKIFIKTFIAGILPNNMIYNYHRKKFNK